MDERMVKKIKKQLSLRENKLFCMHNDKAVCENCKENIRGDVSGITGNVTSIKGDVSSIRGDVSSITGNVTSIRGNVTGIIGDVTDIIKILKEKEAVEE